MMEVKNHIIACIDVLGYQNLIKKKSEMNQENDFLKHVYDSVSLMTCFIEKWNQWIDDIHRDNDNIINGTKMSSFQSLLYSDNILFFAPYNDLADKLNLCHNLAFGIAQFLYQYPKNDIFFRGAITAGPLYYDKEQHFVYGTGLVRAYEIESTIATYPRIVFDKNLENTDILVGLTKDFDGQYFLDYMECCHVLLEQKNEDKESVEKREREILKNQQVAVELALYHYSQNDRVFQKYLWLAEYHNRFCKKNGFDDFVITIPL